MTGLSLALGAWLAVAAAEAAPAPSKDDVAEAGRRFQRATELYEENNLAGALAEFRRAYALSPTYKVLYNVGQICFLMQDFPCAFDSLTRYLEQGGGEVAQQRREEVQRDLAKLQTRVARLRIRVDKPGADVTVDNVSVGQTPIRELVLVTAGRPQIRVTLAGHAPVTRVVEVAGMDLATVDVQLTALVSDAAPAPPDSVLRAGAPAPAPDPADARSDGGPSFAWIATGVLAAGAAVTGGIALWSSSDLEQQRQRIPTEAADLDSRSRRTRNLALATDVLAGAAAVAAIVATVQTLSRPRRAERVAVTLSPAGVGLQGSF
jgi:hypothetical protein